MKNKIRKKWTLAMIVIITGAFLALSGGSVFYFQNNLRGQTIFNEQQKLEQICNHLQYVQQEVQLLVRQLIVDTEFNSYIMEETDEDVFHKLVSEDHMRQVLVRFSNLNQYYYGINVVTEDGEVYSSNSYEGDFDSDALWYQEVMEEADGQGYSRVHTITRPQVSKKETVVSYVNSYHLMQNGEQKNGYVILNFGLDQMVKLEDSEDSLLAGGVLYDGRGNVLLSSGNLTIGYEEAKEYAANANTTLSNGNILIHSENLEDSWMLVAEISSDGLRHEILPMILLLIVIYAVILAVLSVILVYFIRGYTRPIEQLYQAAVSVSEGSLETKVNIRTNDELELLGNAFNQMLDSINSYIVQMEQHEKEKKEMELEQLLLQINPHFIYNTLNTIVYMAQIKGHDDIIQYTNAFIGLLQDTLKIEKEGSLVGLDAEIATIQKYLMLMSYRYPNRFQTIYSIDESVEMCRVPSVMLQPIVENAIFHGLAISKKPGVLEISAKRQDEDVVIEVEDNGCGMSEETLRKIWTDEGNNRDTMRKIGISNVRKRLKAMYGENCSFTIESEEGKGTRVRIRIPYQ